MSERQNEFFLDMADFVYDVLSQTSKFIDNLANLEENYPEDYQNLLEWRNNPLKIIEQLEQIEDDKIKGVIATKLLKIFLKLAALSEKLTNIFFARSDKKREVAKELEDLANEVNECLTMAKEA